MNKKLLKTILGDIRFWIFFFFILRLVGITNAPLEVGHNWRQSLTDMIARNFLEYSSNIFYPSIDMAGEKTGIIGTEFPFFNYLIYLISDIFGYTHWYGRLINLIVSSFGLYYFYKLISNIVDKRVAFNSTVVLIASIWFAFSRKIMPDTFSVSLLIIGLFYAYEYLKNGYKSSLLLFFLFSTLGMLCKIPALSLFSILILVPFISSIPERRRVILSILSIISFSIVSIWYFYWVPYLVETYQYPLYFPKSLSEGIHEIIPLLPELFEKFYFSALHSYIALICFILGLYFFLRSKLKLQKLALLTITSVFILFIIKTGAVFPLHNYYIIPFSPIMALLVGFFLAQIPPKYQYILLTLIMIEGIANQQHDFFIKDDQTYKLSLESINNHIIAREELIIINGGQSPQSIYFAHRKGWSIDSKVLGNKNYLDSLQALGASYLIIDKNYFTDPIDHYQRLYDDRNYSIYKMNER